MAYPGAGRGGTGALGFEAMKRRQSSSSSSSSSSSAGPRDAMPSAGKSRSGGGGRGRSAGMPKPGQRSGGGSPRRTADAMPQPDLNWDDFVGDEEEDRKDGAGSGTPLGFESLGRLPTYPEDKWEDWKPSGGSSHRSSRSESRSRSESTNSVKSAGRAAPATGSGPSVK